MARTLKQLLYDFQRTALWPQRNRGLSQSGPVPASVRLSTHAASPEPCSTPEPRCPTSPGPLYVQLQVPGRVAPSLVAQHLATLAVRDISGDGRVAGAGPTKALW
jgi:hypothetical protein